MLLLIVRTPALKVSRAGVLYMKSRYARALGAHRHNNILERRIIRHGYKHCTSVAMQCKLNLFTAQIIQNILQVQKVETNFDVNAVVFNVQDILGFFLVRVGTLNCQGVIFKLPLDTAKLGISQNSGSL